MREIRAVHAGWGTAATCGPTSDRELLETLLVAHRELTTMTATQVAELRALLLAGDTTDRELARGSLAPATLLRLARRHAPEEANLARIIRTADIRRLALVVRDYRNELAANHDQLAMLVNELAPGLTAQPGMGPVTAAQSILDSAPTAWPDTDTGNRDRRR